MRCSVIRGSTELLTYILCHLTKILPTSLFPVNLLPINLHTWNKITYPNAPTMGIKCLALAVHYQIWCDFALRLCRQSTVFMEDARSARLEGIRCCTATKQGSMLPPNKDPCYHQTRIHVATKQGSMPPNKDPCFHQTRIHVSTKQGSIWPCCHQTRIHVVYL